MKTFFRPFLLLAAISICALGAAQDAPATDELSEINDGVISFTAELLKKAQKEESLAPIEKHKPLLTGLFLWRTWGEVSYPMLPDIIHDAAIGFTMLDVLADNHSKSWASVKEKVEKADDEDAESLILKPEEIEEFKNVRIPLMSEFIDATNKPLETWQFGVGCDLGDLTSTMKILRYVPDNASVLKSMRTYCGNLQEDLDKAPESLKNSVFVKKLKEVAARKTKEKYNDEDAKKLGEDIAAALKSLL